MEQKLLGREMQIQDFNKYSNSHKSEFIAVYGRRRVGKTFLVRQYFKNKFTFYHTGLANATTKEQLANFSVAIKKYAQSEDIATPKNWFEAFTIFRNFLEKSKEKRKIIFLDEMPWMDTPKSNFLSTLEYFWNS